jgi:hypoxanthine phosphoribosyltransferase
VRRLIEADRIRDTVAQLGARISAEHAGRDLTVLGVMTGCLVFVADLIRCIELPLRIGLLQASSYRGKATRPGELALDLSGVPDIAGRDVLLVDDICDSGRTLAALREALLARGPACVKTAVLLWKSDRTEGGFVPDHHGFRIPDEFVVGYGLDYADDYRHLPYVAVLEPGDL